MSAFHWGLDGSLGRSSSGFVKIRLAMILNRSEVGSGVVGAMEGAPDVGAMEGTLVVGAMDSTPVGTLVSKRLGVLVDLDSLPIALSETRVAVNTRRRIIPPRINIVRRWSSE
jgi:hypothetical protein